MQTYRSRPVRDVGQGVLFPLVLVLGGFADAVDPGEGTPGTGPGYIAAGAVIAAAGVVLAISQLKSKIGVTEQGITWSYLLRRKTVPWSDVQDVEVVTGSSVGGTYYSPGIKTTSGLTRINSVIGPRPYVENIVAEIWRSRPGAPAAGQDEPRTDMAARTVEP